MIKMLQALNDGWILHVLAGVSAPSNEYYFTAVTLFFQP
ncbi:hypothetical protein 022DV001_34 [Bacillus phage 022DV001]|nr:hypothetical protein 022DV001_34 [Bacillus phage 022DV001]